mmetsp:Transcript_33716/g.41481  ORF Transcript_33716/g.41481 Transcript_33716/m.41481 type:complete len:290 (+) Transcript_33716:263-1132(+)
MIGCKLIHINRLGLLLVASFSFSSLFTYTFGQQTCSQFELGGYKFDLSSLSQGEAPFQFAGEDVSGQTVIYYANICANLNAVTECKDVVGGGSAVAVRVDKACTVLGEYSQFQYSPWSFIDQSDPKLGLMAEFSPQTVTGCRATMKLQCDESAVEIYPYKGKTLRTVGTSPTNPCITEFNFATNLACPKGPVNPPAASTGSGMSSGSIFFLLLFIGFSLYCVLGLAYNVHQHDREGIEAVPNLTFWAGLYNTARVGCMSVYEQISGLFESSSDSIPAVGGSSSGSYQNI